MMSVLPLALDGLMAVLLAVTISYAAVLNRRLGAWRQDKAELEKLIDRFNRAAQHADVGIATLKEAAEATGRALSQASAKGEALRDDLNFLIERAEPLADRLAERARRPDKPRRAAPAPEPYEIASDPMPAPRAKQEPVKAEPPPEPPKAAAAPRPVIKPYRPAPLNPRANAERTLLQALASLRKG